MDYQLFVTTIKEKLAHSFGADMECYVHDTLKNNGLKRKGITISDKRANLYPTIYMEEFYRQYQDGFSIDCIVENIMDVYQEVRFDHVWDTEIIKSFSSVQSKITYKLIHAEKNRELLKTMPYVPFHDLAIVFYVLFDVDEDGIGTIPVTNQLAALWCTTSQELLSLAKKNSPAILPATFQPMSVVLEELLKESGKSVQHVESVLYILSNSLKNFGAAAILYDGMLEQISEEIGENFFVIPSSIHEMMIVAESNSPAREELCNIVKEANRDHVEVEEVLSDRVYYYDILTKELI